MRRVNLPKTLTPEAPPASADRGRGAPRSACPSGAVADGASARPHGEARRVWISLGAAALGAAVASGCGAAAPPANAEYPALVLPAHHSEDPAAKASTARASATPDARGAAGAPSERATSGAARPALQPRAAGSSLGAPAASGTPGTNDLGQKFTVHTLHGDLPDPQPLSERAWWSFPVTYDRGAITVGDAALVCLPRPQATARRIGRFAFELWIGHELVDRLRFDFPLLASEEPPPGPRRPLHETPRFAPGARVSVTLRVPASDRPTSARVFDRATGDAIAVTWPPRTADGTPRPHRCPAAGPASKAVRPRTTTPDAGR